MFSSTSLRAHLPTLHRTLPKRGVWGPFLSANILTRLRLFQCPFQNSIESKHGRDRGSPHALKGPVPPPPPRCRPGPAGSAALLPAARRHSRLHCPRSLPSRPRRLPLLSSGRENGEGQSQTLEDATRARDGQVETEKGREVTMHRLQPPAPWAPGDRGGCVKRRAVDSLRDLKVRIRND